MQFHQLRSQPKSFCNLTIGNIHPAINVSLLKMVAEPEHLPY